MFPLSLLRKAENRAMLVELKNGETYNGHLQSCDSWMNLQLREVTLTSRDGDQFWKIAEVYIRGNTIKYLRIPDEVIKLVKDEEDAKAKEGGDGGGRGYGGRGRGGGRGGRRGGGGGRRGRGGGRGGGGRS